ncbi:hypothetical protein [uncultured Shimia sp.]|uniref:hypothetical protein n=1 Tax=uncultured Shimia sp. TaxID=573152 RepID=UPI0025FA7FB2|nr:hypothetical protein [uncultured Shimia sp.]
MFEKLVDLSILVGDMEARAEAFLVEDRPGRERILTNMKKRIFLQREALLKECAGSPHFQQLPWAQVLDALRAPQLVETWDLENDGTWGAKGVMINELFERAMLTLNVAQLLVSEAELSVAEAVYIDLTDAPRAKE